MKPCKYCGGRAVESLLIVRCTQCGAHTENFTGRGGQYQREQRMAIEAWESGEYEQVDKAAIPASPASAQPALTPHDSDIERLLDQAEEGSSTGTEPASQPVVALPEGLAESLKAAPFFLSPHMAYAVAKHVAATPAPASASVVPEDERWAIAKETVVEIPGERPMLGYTICQDIPLFASQSEASAAISALGLPLGWVIGKVSQFVPSISTPVAEQPSNPHSAPEPAAQDSGKVTGEKAAALLGWKLVPIEPTADMLRAAGYGLSADGASTTGHEVYRAMIDNAPDSPAAADTAAGAPALMLSVSLPDADALALSKYTEDLILWARRTAVDAGGLPERLSSPNAPYGLLRECLASLDRSLDFSLRADIERVLAARAAAVMAGCHEKQTDLSKRLRDAIASDTHIPASEMNDLLRVAADEIDRYYGGMLAWKQTAEAKDRTAAMGAGGLSDDSLQAIIDKANRTGTGADADWSIAIGVRAAMRAANGAAGQKGGAT